MQKQYLLRFFVSGYVGFVVAGSGSSFAPYPKGGEEPSPALMASAVRPIIS
jgi:hypothetical protein